MCLSAQLQETLNPQPSTQPDAFEQSQLSPGIPSSPESPPPLPPPLHTEGEVTAPVVGEHPNKQRPSRFITEKEVRMAVGLTEYFQEVRRVLEQVSCYKYV